MENIMNNWIIGVIILPVVVGLFKAEIGKILTAWNVYRLRAFDTDGNPATSDKVQLLNGATGQWGDAWIKYRFSLSARKRGVYITYPDGGKEKVTLLTWATWRKRVPPKPGGGIKTH